MHAHTRTSEAVRKAMEATDEFKNDGELLRTLLEIIRWEITELNINLLAPAKKMHGEKRAHAMRIYSENKKNLVETFGLIYQAVEAQKEILALTLDRKKRCNAKRTFSFFIERIMRLTAKLDLINIWLQGIYSRLKRIKDNALDIQRYVLTFA